MCATCGCADGAQIRHQHDDGTWHSPAAHDPGTPDHDTPDHDTPDHDTPEHRAPEHRAPDHGAPEHRASDHDAPDHGAPDHGAPHRGTPEHRAPEHGAHAQEHGTNGHGHGAHQHEHGQSVTLEEKVLARNDALARQNRDWLRARGVLALNLMGSPGAGKTTLLERTARDLAGELVIGVIEGDQETALDADRMRAAGCRVVQVNTGTGCHLDAAMVRDALTALDPPAGSVVVIENVGNLVCPALFGLGEAHRVVLASVTEGADKPVKYPHMFRSAGLVLVSKTDLLPYLDFDLARCTADLAAISPKATVLPVSARDGDGTGRWYDWLRQWVPLTSAG